MKEKKSINQTKEVYENLAFILSSILLHIASQLPESIDVTASFKKGIVTSKGFDFSHKEEALVLIRVAVCLFFSLPGTEETQPL